MAESLKTPEMETVIRGAVASEVTVLKKLEPRAKLIVDPNAFIEWMVSRSEYFALAYEQTLARARAGNMTEAKQGQMYHGDTFERFAEVYYAVKTFFDTEGRIVNLSKQKTNATIRKLNKAKRKAFERNPSFFSGRFLVNSRYQPDGLQVHNEEISPLEHAVNPNSRYIRHKLEPYALAREEFPMFFTDQTKVKIITGSDIHVGIRDGQPVEAPYAGFGKVEMQNLFDAVYYNYRPNPLSRTLAEHRVPVSLTEWTPPQWAAEHAEPKRIIRVAYNPA